MDRAGDASHNTGKSNNSGKKSQHHHKHTSKEVIDLIFGDPKSFDYREDYYVIDVGTDMLDTIKKGARQLIDSDGCTCYVFGELCDADEYEHITKFSSDNNTIGLLYRERAREKHKNNKDQLTRNYEEMGGKTQYNDYNYIIKLQPNYNEILWVGRIMHPDSKNRDAHLHIHVDGKKDCIDSILIDCGYIYDAVDEDEDSDDDSSTESRASIKRNNDDESVKTGELE